MALTQSSLHTLISNNSVGPAMVLGTSALTHNQPISAAMGTQNMASDGREQLRRGE